MNSSSSAPGPASSPQHVPRRRPSLNPGLDLAGLSVRRYRIAAAQVLGSDHGSPRIGNHEGAEWPWRYCHRGSRFVFRALGPRPASSADRPRRVLETRTAGGRLWCRRSHPPHGHHFVAGAWCFPTPATTATLSCRWRRRRRRTRTRARLRSTRAAGLALLELDCSLLADGLVWEVDRRDRRLLTSPQIRAGWCPPSTGPPFTRSSMRRGLCRRGHPDAGREVARRRRRTRLKNRCSRAFRSCPIRRWRRTEPAGRIPRGR